MTQIPNIITLLRMAGSFGLLFYDVTGVVFWIIYGLCGISDIADGWLAQKLKYVSKKGALLDSLADICFVACCAWKLLPILELPQWLWLWAGVIVAIKVVNQLSALVMLRALLLPSHPREQMGGIPAIHCSPHDILVNHSHLNRCNRRNVCCHTRGTFHKNKK
ncbi:MAG: CDP-alcohol phosphatidyltransferase family protein [Bacteroidales bacterium]|nr:CDP-alcohol phosphatidyltransferase family protein [Bacteroidales bacterium]